MRSDFMLMHLCAFACENERTARIELTEQTNKKMKHTIGFSFFLYGSRFFVLLSLLHASNEITIKRKRPKEIADKHHHLMLIHATIWLKYFQTAIHFHRLFVYDNSVRFRLLRTTIDADECLCMYSLYFISFQYDVRVVFVCVFFNLAIVNSLIVLRAAISLLKMVRIVINWHCYPFQINPNNGHKHKLYATVVSLVAIFRSTLIQCRYN